MNTATRPAPTEGELRAAWEYCRCSPRMAWPGTYEEAMADATLSRLVHLTARHPPRSCAPAAPAPPRLPKRWPRDRGTTGWLPGAAPAGIDRKRAAAGERDDD